MKFKPTSVVPALAFTLALACLLFPISPGGIAEHGAQRQQQPTNRQLDRSPSQPSRAGQRRLALVMGNGAYQNANPLKNPPNDAKAIADALRELGFEVTLGTNKPQREMKQMMREFGQRLRTQGGVGLFYYAGHGVQAKGRNYLVPVAAVIQSEADLEDEAIDVNYVLNLMDEAQNALNIVILDACRNNPFGRSFRSAQNGLAQVKAPTGTLIAYATAPDDIAADGGGSNSPYTEELIKEMRQPGVLVETMFRRVAEQVSSRSGGRQEPWFSANVKGDFYFKAVANDASGPTTRSKPNATLADATTVEAEYWESIKESNDKTDFQDYLKEYPQGRYAPLARVKLRQLEAASKPNDGKPNNVGAGNAGVTSGAANTTGNTTGGARPALKAGAVVKNQMGIEMVYIPPGSFMMGSTNGDYDEKPVHRVTISQAFYIGRYEVTQAQWQAVMGTTVQQQRDKANTSWPMRGEGDNYPMYYVSWEEAKSFVQRLNALNDGYLYRLPTEAEWEYACRAGTTGDYAGDLDSLAWYGNNSGNGYIDAESIMKNDQKNYDKRIVNNGGRTHQVGTKQANGFGLYDMHGNVWEWCEDWYHPSYEGAPNDGSAWLSGGEQKYRVLRGGSWDINATNLGSALRDSNAPDSRNSNGGFRVVAMLRTP